MATDAPSTGAPLCAPVESAPTPESLTFDPAAWLGRFAAAGGGYAVSVLGISLCVSFEHTTPAQQGDACEMIRDLTDDHVACLRAHMRANETREG